MSQAGRFSGGGGGVGSVLFLAGNSGGDVGPDGLGVINVVGSGDINVVGNAGTHTLTISLSGAIADTYDTDSGSATPSAGIINILGGTGISTSASGNTISIDLSGVGIVESIIGDTGSAISGSLTITGGSSGASFDTTGTTITESFDFLSMDDTNNPLTTGYIAIGLTPVFAMYGGVSANNTCVGPEAGAQDMSGHQNVCVGSGALSKGANSVANSVVIGFESGFNLASGSQNVIIGTDSLNVATSSSANVSIGYSSAAGLLTGTGNIIIGTSSAGNYTGAESSNIVIGANGTTGESNAIHIGSSASTCAISGIYSSTVGGTNGLVYCDDTGKLGTSGGTFPSLGTTNNAVQVGNSSGGLASLTVGTDGQVLVGSTGTDPIFATLGSNGSLSYATGTGTLSISISAPVSIANGGTNATSMASTDGIVYYDGTSLVTTSAGTSGQVLTSNGAGVAPTYQAAGGGGVSSLAGDSGGPLTGALTLTGGISGAVFTGSGTTLTTTFTKLDMSDTTTTTGYIQIGTQKVLACWGGVASNNVFVGPLAGHTTVSGTDNDALGAQALNSVTSGDFNIAIGSSALQVMTTSSSNVAIGLNALSALTTGGGNNTAIGFVSGGSMSTGANNTIIGSSAGGGYTGSESANIVIGAQGVAAESHAIHIGDDTTYGAFTKCFIGGISGVTVASSAAVLINTSTGQLGTVISSLRYKENIRDMSARDSMKIHELRPVEFTYKNDPDEKKRFGLIAEEVEEAIPYMVAYNRDGEPETVGYHELPILLLKEVQRLNLKIQEFEDKFKSRMRG